MRRVDLLRKCVLYLYLRGCYYIIGMVEYNKAVIKRGAYLEQWESYSETGGAFGDSFA